MLANSPAHSLARLFPNPAVLDVLALLLMNPEQEFYQREIVQRVGCAPLQVQRALKRIDDAGFLIDRRAGNRVYYKSNRNHPAFGEMKSLIIKSVGLGDQLISALLPFVGNLRFAFVFGSVAAGTEQGSSDVDLLCVGNLSARDAAKVFGPLGRVVNREFNPLFYSDEEFRLKIKGNNTFIHNILVGPKIWLIGSEDELKQVVG